MSGTRVLVLLALLVGSVYCFSWDIVVCVDERLEFYYNGTLTHVEDIPSVISIHSITYDPVQYRILYYHVRNYNMTISSYDISTRKIEPLFNGISNGYNARVVYDPITQVIFWKEGRSIYSFSLNPASSNETRNSILLFTLDRYCYDIAVDSCGGYIYWITNLEVERSRFDGSEREVLVDSKVYDRRSLVIDQQTQKIYWTETIYVNDVYQLAIESANFDGNNRSTFYILRNVTYANSMAVSKDFIYAQYHNQEGIWQITKTQYKNVTSKLYLKYKSECWGCHLMVANYTIKEQIQGIESCVSLKHLIPDNSESKSTVSTCQNYCFQGDCSVSAAEQPKCSCKAGYSGERCEVNECYKHCLNGGVCSLNEEEQPVCQCTADYDGERCDVPTYLIKCIQTVSNLKDMLNANVTSVTLGKGVKSTCTGPVV